MVMVSSVVMVVVGGGDGGGGKHVLDERRGGGKRVWGLFYKFYINGGAPSNFRVWVIAGEWTQRQPPL